MYLRPLQEHTEYLYVLHKSDKDFTLLKTVSEWDRTETTWCPYTLLFLYRKIVEKSRPYIRYSSKIIQKHQFTCRQIRFINKRYQNIILNLTTHGVWIGSYSNNMVSVYRTLYNLITVQNKFQILLNAVSGSDNTETTHCL